jgi:vacuolar protein sorting-associated protein 35
MYDHMLLAARGCAELRHLEAYISSEHKRGRRMLELYELVQHAGNVLPRLYLLLTVGSVYIVSQEAAAKDILTDLVEMCRGVQHPMRGLFLRNYLAQASKSKLPDTGSEYEGAGGTVADAVSFVLSNFSEMNKLWVRMQHQGPVREREAREKERLELRVLVGANLSQLSALEGVDLQMYQETVLPQVLEQVVNCRDAIAQQYLMECLAQAFPTEYHIPTLPSWLQHTSWLAPGADIKALLAVMMDRLAADAVVPAEGEGAATGEAGGSSSEGEGGGSQAGAPFELLAAHLATLHPGAAAASEQPAAGAASGVTPISFEPADVLELYEGLLKFVLSTYPKNVSYIERTLAACAALLGAAPAGLGATSKKASATLMSIVTKPLAHFPAILTLLELPSWPPLLSNLSYSDQKEVAAELVGAVIAQQVPISSPGDAGTLLKFVQPLMNDDPAHTAAADAAREAPIDDETALELGPVSRLIHAFKAPDTDDQCRILNSAHKQASAGAFRRSPFTLVPVVFACLPLARQIRLRVLAGETVEVGVHKLLGFVATIVASLAPTAPSLALRLNLLCAHVADSCGEEADAYEFMTGAMTTYEEDISDSKAQLQAVQLAAATLHHTRAFTSDNYDTLATKTTQYSARLLKKPDQARAVCKASFLFSTSACHAAATPAAAAAEPDVSAEGDGGGEGAAASSGAAAGTVAEREPKRVLECLQRALKIADACKATGLHVPLFVECLSTYLLHYAAASPAITPKYITSLLQLIAQQLAEADAASDTIVKAKAHFENTKGYLRAKRKADPRFEEIECDA